MKNLVTNMQNMQLCINKKSVGRTTIVTLSKARFVDRRSRNTTMSTSATKQKIKKRRYLIRLGHHSLRKNFHLGRIVASAAIRNLKRSYATQITEREINNGKLGIGTPDLFH